MMANCIFKENYLYPPSYMNTGIINNYPHVQTIKVIISVFCYKIIEFSTMKTIHQFIVLILPCKHCTDYEIFQRYIELCRLCVVF